jgi:hypothetical protein
MIARLSAVLACCVFALPLAAELVPFDASYSLQGLGDLAPIGVGPGVAEVNPSGLGGTHLTHLGLPGGIATVMTTATPTTPPSTFPYTKIIATVADGPGTFTETSGGALRGVMPIAGTVRLCLGFGCALFLDIPLTENGTRGVGLGGPPITTMLGTLATISLQGDAWSTGSITIGTSLGGTTMVKGTAHGSASQASSTAIGMGVVQMVTPITVTVASSGGTPATLDLFGVLDVQFMPEPQRGALLGVGAAGMAALGWARRRRRR